MNGEYRVKNQAPVIRNADRIFPVMLDKMKGIISKNPYERIVISISGGSGTGKTSITCLLSEYLNKIGIPSLVLSGDNYPVRIPKYNDAERLRIFRESGMQRMIAEGVYTEESAEQLKILQEQRKDADSDNQYSWTTAYLKGGEEGLRSYLGTEKEQNFQMVSEILSKFHNGEDAIWIRHMGREESEISYEYVDVSKIQVLLVEWTHANSDRLQGSDLSIMLKGTPKETLSSRLKRNRDAEIDHPFTRLVLSIEQDLLDAQEEKADIILSREGELLKGKEDIDNSLRQEEMENMQCGPMLNAYPDSVGGKLSNMVSLLKLPEFKNVFQSFYILPSLFNTDLDRGFSVIDYGINEQLADAESLEEISALGIDLKLDFIMNHASVWSKQFQDLVKNGEKSKYKDFFIDWNQFWKGYGEMTDEGYILPKEEYLQKMFFRKPGLPILMVRFPDGKEVPYWNTFYQEIRYPKMEVSNLMEHLDIQYDSADRLVKLINQELEEGKKPKDIDFRQFNKYRDAVLNLLEEQKSYLGQMDLNIQSPLVWDYYREVIKTLAGYGAKIVRLDAFAYAPKTPGEHNFLNEPGTWELLERVQQIADQYHLKLLPEIHASYEEGIYETLTKKGYMTYDFFLPGLILDAIEEKNGAALADWAREQQEKGIRSVNMLGCHDGIPLLDLKGMIPKERIEKLIETLISRGGYVKNLHGQKNMYYQVNATYYSALGEDDKKMLLARAIQMFMPGKPQVWYLDLFAGKNDYEAVKRAGEGGHKEINRTNLSEKQIQSAMQTEIVQRQLDLIRFRNQCPAFGENAKLTVNTEASKIEFIWENNNSKAVLQADFETYDFLIKTE